MIKYLAFILCFTFIIPASSNGFADNSSKNELLDIISNLKTSNKIKLLFQDDTIIVGRFSKIGNDSIFIFIDEKENSYSIKKITSLWVQGHATFKGTKVGAIIGSISGLALGVLLHGITKGSDVHPDNQVFIVSPMLGAFVGVLFGTPIGALGTKWNLKYHNGKKIVTNKVGSFRLLLGLSKHKTYYGNYGFGGQFNYLIPLHSHIAIGPELSYHKARFYYSGGIATFKLNKQPAPYLILGAGFGLANNVDGEFIYSFGCGFSYNILSQLSVSAETRWHKINSKWINDFLDIRAGLEFSW